MLFPSLDDWSQWLSRPDAKIKRFAPYHKHWSARVKLLFRFSSRPSKQGNSWLQEWAVCGNSCLFRRETDGSQHNGLKKVCFKNENRQCYRREKKALLMNNDKSTPSPGDAAAIRLRCRLVLKQSLYTNVARWRTTGVARSSEERFCDAATTVQMFGPVRSSIVLTAERGPKAIGDWFQLTYICTSLLINQDGAH